MIFYGFSTIEVSYLKKIIRFLSVLSSSLRASYAPSMSTLSFSLIALTSFLSIFLSVSYPRFKYLVNKNLKAPISWLIFLKKLAKSIEILLSPIIRSAIPFSLSKIIGIIALQAQAAMTIPQIFDTSSSGPRVSSSPGQSQMLNSSSSASALNQIDLIYFVQEIQSELISTDFKASGFLTLSPNSENVMCAVSPCSDCCISLIIFDPAK